MPEIYNNNANPFASYINITAVSLYYLRKCLKNISEIKMVSVYGKEYTTNEPPPPPRKIHPFFGFDY